MYIDYYEEQENHHQNAESNRQKLEYDQAPRPVSDSIKQQSKKQEQDNGNMNQVEQSSLKQSLMEILRVEPDTEYLDLSDQNIASIEKDLEPFLSQFKFLKELNLEDNSIKSLPLNLAKILPKMEIINLNGNDFDDFNQTVTILKDLVNLKSLFLNLHEEEQVDFVMRTLQDLQELNGLPVERDLMDDDESESLQEEKELPVAYQQEQRQQVQIANNGFHHLEQIEEQEQKEISSDGKCEQINNAFQQNMQSQQKEIKQQIHSGHSSVRGQNLSQAYKDDEKNFLKKQFSNKEIKEYSGDKKSQQINAHTTPYDQAVKNSQKSQSSQNQSNNNSNKKLKNNFNNQSQQNLKDPFFIQHNQKDQYSQRSNQMESSLQQKQITILQEPVNEYHENQNSPQQAIINLAYQSVNQIQNNPAENQAKQEEVFYAGSGYNSSTGVQIAGIFSDINQKHRQYGTSQQINVHKNPTISLQQISVHQEEINPPNQEMSIQIFDQPTSTQQLEEYKPYILNYIKGIHTSYNQQFQNYQDSSKLLDLQFFEQIAENYDRLRVCFIQKQNSVKQPNEKIVTDKDLASMFEQLLNYCFSPQDQKGQKDIFNLQKNPQYLFTALLNEQMQKCLLMDQDRNISQVAKDVDQIQKLFYESQIEILRSLSDQKQNLVERMSEELQKVESRANKESQQRKIAEEKIQQLEIQLKNQSQNQHFNFIDQSQIQSSYQDQQLVNQQQQRINGVSSQQQFGSHDKRGTPLKEESQTRVKHNFNQRSRSSAIVENNLSTAEHSQNSKNAFMSQMPSKIPQTINTQLNNLDTKIPHIQIHESHTTKNIYNKNHAQSQIFANKSSLQSQHSLKPKQHMRPQNSYHIHSNPTFSVTNSLGPIQHRQLTIKQLKDTIQDIYSQKIKFDKKSEETHQARETLYHFLYTYLNQKYGLKNLIIEQVVALINGIQKHKDTDHDIKLFGKILKNECDEEFRFIQMHVRDTLQNLLRVLLRERYQFKGEKDIQKMLDQIQGGQQIQNQNQNQSQNGGVIDEWMWRRIIEKMYDLEDSKELEYRFSAKIQQRDESQQFSHQYVGSISDMQIAQFLNQKNINPNAAKKMSREEIMNMMRQKSQGKLLYNDFQKIILDFQLEEHEKFLQNFTNLFKEIDQQKLGYINEEQFKELMRRMKMISQEDEVIYLLGEVDPFNNNKMTYSEIVQLLSNHMVTNHDDPSLPQQSIPILEKFSLISQEIPNFVVNQNLNFIEQNQYIGDQNNPQMQNFVYQEPLQLNQQEQHGFNRNFGIMDNYQHSNLQQ